MSTEKAVRHGMGSLTQDHGLINPEPPCLTQIGQVEEEYVERDHAELSRTTSDPQLRKDQSRLLLHRCPTSLAGFPSVSVALIGSSKEGRKPSLSSEPRGKRIVYGYAFGEDATKNERSPNPTSFCAFASGPSSNQLRIICLSEGIDGGENLASKRLDVGRQGYWNGELGPIELLSTIGDRNEDHCKSRIADGIHTALFRFYADSGQLGWPWARETLWSSSDRLYETSPSTARGPVKEVVRSIWTLFFASGFRGDRMGGSQILHFVHPTLIE